MEQQTFIIKTLGCKVNQYDTQMIREQLLACGFKEIDDNGVAANIYIINTCTVTQKADKESREFIKLSIKVNPDAKVIVTGCYVEKDTDEILRIPGISAIVKNEQKDKIYSFLSTTHHLPPATSNGISHFKDHTRAFIKIQEGCDNFCSYCKVPFVRGKPKSRNLDEILQETKRLVEGNFKEIVLCGICLGSYGCDLNKAIRLADIIETIEKIDGQFRLRLSSIEMQDVTDELIGKIANSKRTCHHLHIPLQSGDDDVLRDMNRRYKSGDFKGLVYKIRSAIPDLGLTTDVLVGFPGETEEKFRNTLNLIREITPSRIHAFGYSPRKGTAAEKFSNRVTPNVIKKRLDELIRVSKELSLRCKYNLIGKHCDVLIETTRDKHAGLLTGYSSCYIKILVDGDDSIMNNIVKVKVIKVNSKGEVFGVISKRETFL